MWSYIDNRGEKNGNHKLTEQEVREIRAERAEKRTKLLALAFKYGVSRRTISDVLCFSTWKHVK
jgi:hypothetical protein